MGKGATPSPPSVLQRKGHPTKGCSSTAHVHSHCRACACPPSLTVCREDGKYSCDWEPTQDVKESWTARKDPQIMDSKSYRLH